MNTTTIDGEEDPLTAAWLRANTRIRGWLAFFIFALAAGGLVSLIYPFATYKASDYAGSSLLGMTDLALGVVLAVVAGWSIVSLYRRSPAAIFWAKFYTVLVLLSNGLGLWFGGVEMSDGDAFGGTRMAVKGVVWSIVWFLYLTFSQQVQEIIPKRYRRAGVRTWLYAGLLLLVPLAFVIVGAVDVAVNYHSNVEISQSELSNGELTDGHVVFDRLEGWSFGMTRETGVNVCSFTNGQEHVLSLFSALDSDASKDNFLQTAAVCAVADFEALAHQTVRDDTDTVNGHVYYYRVVRYDRDDETSIFWHLACLFDGETSKAVVVNGYFLSKDVPEVMQLLKSVRFKK